MYKSFDDTWKAIVFQLIILHYNATHNNNNDNNQVTGCSFVGSMHSAWLRYGQQTQHIRTNSKPEYSHLSNKRDVTLTDFGKFHHAQNKNPPCTFIDFITEL